MPLSRSSTMNSLRRRSVLVRGVSFRGSILGMAGVYGAESRPQPLVRMVQTRAVAATWLFLSAAVIAGNVGALVFVFWHDDVPTSLGWAAASVLGAVWFNRLVISAVQRYYAPAQRRHAEKAEGEADEEKGGSSDGEQHSDVEESVQPSTATVGRLPARARLVNAI